MQENLCMKLAPYEKGGSAFTWIINTEYEVTI